MSVTLTVLKGARRRIERGWCQLAPARNARGLRVSSIAPEAACWCLTGALHAADELDVVERVRGITPVDRVFEAIGIAPVSLPAWNDCSERTQEQVLAVLDRGH